MAPPWIVPEPVRCDEDELVFAVPWRDRVWGFPFAALGLAAITMPLVLGPDNLGVDPADLSPRVAMVMATLFGALFVVIGWSLAFGIDELRLALATHRWVRRKGTVPFVRRDTGSFDDFGRLLLESEARDFDGRRYTIWKVSLVWKDGDLEPVALLEKRAPRPASGTDVRDSAYRDMLKFADRLGLEAGEIDPRPAVPVAGDAGPPASGEMLRTRLYGDTEMRHRERGKAPVVLGIMAVLSVSVCVSAEWALAGAAAVSGYLVWCAFVAYVTVGVVWEELEPSFPAPASRARRRAALIAFALVASAVCLIAPLLWP